MEEKKKIDGIEGRTQTGRETWTRNKEIRSKDRQEGHRKGERAWTRNENINRKKRQKSITMWTRKQRLDQEVRT